MHIVLSQKMEINQTVYKNKFILIEQCEELNLKVLKALELLYIIQL